MQAKDLFSKIMPMTKNSHYTIIDAIRATQEELAKQGKGKSPILDSYLNMMKKGENPLQQIIQEATRVGVSDNEIKKAIKYAKYTGEWWADYQAVSEAIEKIKTIHKTKSEQTKSEDISQIINDHFDYQRDADLIAHALFIDPRVKEEFGERLESLYRAVIHYGGKKKKDRDASEKQRNGGNGSYSKENPVYSEGLEKLITALPTEVFSQDDKEYTGLRKLIRKKANREALKHFKADTESGLQFLRKKIESEENANIRFVYNDTLKHFENYTKFELKEINQNFKDQVTGKTGNFPSLHQRIGAYHGVEKQRFGILDGCGTGKTAIGALMHPLIKEKKQEKGEKVHDRVLVLGTIPCLDTWQRGFAGEDHERYLSDKKKFTVVNGGKRNDELLEELKDSQVIFANYQQLTADFDLKSGKKPVYQVLKEIGFDLVVFDEVHNIKNRSTQTKGKKLTHSAAARELAMNDYFLLLSGTPMPDNLQDYGMIYHLLRPDECPDPNSFVKMLRSEHYNPHKLSEFIDENTLRRTAEEVNDLIHIDRDNCFEDIEMSDVQMRIHDYLISHRPLGWLMEARKAMVDPRLVDPRILKKLDLIGKVSFKDASKFNRLEQLVTEKGGPLEQNEKFIVFSSLLKQGVTRTAETVKEEYAALGLTKEYEKLGLEKNFKESLEQAVKKAYGKDKYVLVVDGNVSLQERQKIAKQFKQDTNLVGLICTTETGGESLNLANATYGYFLDEDYSPATTEQAIARLWRRGQSKEVKIKFLRGLNTLDESITDYVERKSLAIKIALDGHPLTPEEESLLTETENHRRLINMIEAKFGGISVDVSKYTQFELEDVAVKRGLKPSSRDAHPTPNGYDTTRAQEIGRRISSDKKCWFDEEFAEEYAEALAELSPYLIHRMKILDLLKRAQNEEIEFPEKIIALGSGPSILYDAYQDLEEVIERTGYKLPEIHDLDFSKEMLTHGKNPHKIFGNMTKVPAEDETYDMVDNASISLLESPSDVKKSLLEAHRILKQGGLLELSVKSLYFREPVNHEDIEYDGFYKSLEKLGFEVLTKPRSSLSLSNPAHKKMSAEHGQGFADACKRKLDKAHFILARKIGEPMEVDSNEFWFQKGPTEEDDIPQVRDPSESRSIVKVRKRRGPKRDKQTGTRTKDGYWVNKDGTIDTK